MKLLFISVFIISIFAFIPTTIFRIDDYTKESISVSIQGQVKEEKIIELPRFSTIEDALKQIELLEDAELYDLNLLTVLKDNDVIYIPKKLEFKRISINTCNAEDLQRIKGIGEKKANSIIEYREKNGYFQKLEDIMNVKGIGPKMFEKIKDYICL